MNDDAPGCYGSVIAFSNDSQTCRSCNYRGNCSELAIEGLNRLALELNVQSIRKQMNAPQKVEVKPKAANVAVEAATVANTETVQSKGVSAKAQKVIDSIKKRRIDFGRIKQGKNPFALDKPTYMKIACSLLISTTGFDEEDLARLLIDAGEAGSNSEADSLLRTIKEILCHFGVIEVDGTWWRKL